MTDEHTIFEGKIPFKVIHFSHSWIWLLLLGWNIGLLLSWLQSLGETVKITSQRLVLTQGVISKDMEEVEYYRVKDTKFQQTFFQRVVGIGDITLFSDDTTAPNLTFTIHDPGHFREEIRKSINAERQRMGAVQVD